MASLYFKGKSVVWNHHLSVSYHILAKDKKKSLKGKNEDENLIIEGDNLLALKALLPKYQGRVKCIYIDPPYNTGNEGWAYNDNVNNPLMKNWIGEVVGKDDLTRHDKWLCMMTPRLKLLQELLSNDGVIFASIDENEVHHLRQLMDEIFIESNFITNFIWNHRKSSQNDIDFSLSHNNTLCYAKNRENFKFNSLEIDEAKFSNPDNDPRGPWVADPFDAPNIRPNLTYPIINPNTSVKYLPPPGRCWRTTREKFLEALKDNRIIWGKSGKSKPQMKRFQSDAELKGTNPFTIWDDVGTATEGTQELMEIFGGVKVFDTPKPVSFINKILKLSTNKDSIILDSFAGSGTTAQAVIEMNNDGGSRKFILIQLPETLTAKAQAKAAGYDYVHEITRDRVKKVIKRDGLDVGFTYYKLGPSIDADSILAGKLPTYEDFAKYVFYLATGKNHPDEKKIKEKDYFVGKLNNESIYLLYKKDINILKNLSITLDWAEQINKKNSGKKIVYAPACFLDDEYLERFNIQFVSIPYNLLEKK
ncbi:MAG: site-specific DNA-methyltransferase [Patescibacteria group bacterium]